MRSKNNIIVAIVLFTVKCAVANVVTNSFIIAQGNGVSVSQDGSIIHDKRANDDIIVRARSGWLVNGRDSVSLSASRGGMLKVMSRLGEDEEHVHVNPSETNEVHSSDIILGVLPKSDNLIAMYALPDTSSVVSVSATCKVIEKGSHEETTTYYPCACGEIYDSQETDKTYDVTPKSCEWTALCANRTLSSSTWTGEISKGLAQSIEFTVTGKRDVCSSCISTATTNVLVDVHELSVTNDLYLGLDRTDLGRTNPVVKTAIAKIDPTPTGSSAYLWTDCGICSFTGRTDQAEVKYFASNPDKASESYLAEPLTVRGTATNAEGLSASANCTTNFTVVKVDVTIGGVDEEKEEKEGAFIQYVADAANGDISVEETNKLVSVRFTCEPHDLPENEQVNISCTGPGELYEKLPSGELVRVESKNYLANEISRFEFALHGHEVSGFCKDGLIKIEHLASEAVDVVKYTCVKVNLKEVSFSGLKCHFVKKDDGSMDYATPHWQDNSIPLDNDASDINDRSYPVSFTRNSKMKVSVKWILEPQNLPLAIIVKGDGPNLLDFPETTVVKNGSQLSVVDLECENSFANKVDYFDPMMIKWSVSIGTNRMKNWLDGGVSSNQTYVTLGDPLTTVYHTLVHIGCKNAQDESSPEKCTEKIWKEFIDRDVRRIDGVQLTYYASYDCKNITTADLLLNGDGQCGAWASFFIDLRKVQGIDDKDEYVIFSPSQTPMDYSGFLVKNWTFKNKGLSGYPEYPYINILDSNFIGHSGYRWKYSDVNDAIGMPGQGNENPASLFNNHQVVIGDKYYDPSYGVQYSSLEELESESIEGFYIGPFSIAVDETVVNCDLNNDGDKMDSQIMVNAIFIRKNNPGLEIHEVRYDR